MDEPARQTKTLELGGYTFHLTMPTVGEVEDLDTAVGYKEVQRDLMYVLDAYAKFGEAQIKDATELKALALEGATIARRGVDCYFETNDRLLALVASVDHDQYRGLPADVGFALAEEVRQWIALEVMADPARKRWNTLSIAHSTGAQRHTPNSATSSSNNESGSTKLSTPPTRGAAGGENSASSGARSSQPTV